MSLLVIFLVGIFLLGLCLSALVLAFAIKLYGDYGEVLAEKTIGMGLKSIYKPAVTFDGSEELNLKKRSYDEDHDTEYISFGGLMSSVRRHLFDPEHRKHSFYGTPFALVDERFGVVFDPRDVAVGARMRARLDNGEYIYEREKGNQLIRRVLGVFGFKQGNVGVPELSHVWTLVGGNAPARVIDIIEEYYKKGQEPKTKSTAMRQLLMPIGAFLMVLLIGVLASGQGGGAAAGGGAPTTPGGNRSVGVGGILLLLASTSGLSLRERPRDVLVTAGFTAAFMGVFGVLFKFLPMPFHMLGFTLPLGVWGFILFALGLSLPPFLATFFGRALGPFGMLLGKLYLIIGLLRYNRPVIRLNEAEQYEVVEYDPDEFGHEPFWYRFALTRVGISFENTQDAWPGLDTVIHPEELRTLAENGNQQDAPYGYTATPEIGSAGYEGYVPDDPDDNSVYVQTKHVTGPFADAGKHTALLVSALTWAKEKHGGGGQPISDTQIMAMTAGAIGVALLIDFMVFF